MNYTIRFNQEFVGFIEDEYFADIARYEGLHGVKNCNDPCMVDLVNPKIIATCAEKALEATLVLHFGPLGVDVERTPTARHDFVLTSGPTELHVELKTSRGRRPPKGRAERFSNGGYRDANYHFQQMRTEDPEVLNVLVGIGNDFFIGDSFSGLRIYAFESGLLDPEAGNCNPVGSDEVNVSFNAASNKSSHKCGWVRDHETSIDALFDGISRKLGL